MIAGLFEPPAWLISWFYAITHNYILAIAMIALVVMLITAPLQLKATKGMLEMQRLQPQLRKLQAQHRGDRQKLNEEMMKLYQEHKVNPLASCFPLLLQFPVFIIMFRVLHGLTNTGADGTFEPLYVSKSSEIYQSLVGKTEMLAWGLDLAKRPIEAMGNLSLEGLVYGGLVVILGVLYYVQQRMVAARAAVSPTMSPTQQKIMQYLPVVFAVFLVFYLTGLVIYYMAQAIFRIGLQWYTTKRFYHGEESLGRQAQKASNEAREIAKADGGGTGMFAQVKREAAAAKSPAKGADKAAPAPTTSKRITPPKNKPTTASSRGGRPAPTGKAAQQRPPAPRTKKK
jgi:YidC/Oxa1 family membrane protein insertase